MFLFAALPEPSPAGDVYKAFLSILFEGAPYILLGTVFSGFIGVFLKNEHLSRVMPKNAMVATFLGGLLGLVFPVCECAIVPVIRRLVEKGLPLGCAVAYMLAAPIVNPIVMISTMTAFGEFKTIAAAGTLAAAPMMLSRASLGYAVAVLTGLILLRFGVRQVLRDRLADSIERPSGGGSGSSANLNFDQKLVHAMRAAMRDFLDTGMYFTIGVVLTALFNTQVNQAIFGQLAAQPTIALPSLMGLAMVLSLCSTSDAFVAAPMAAFSQAAKLAFLVFGPMMDIKLLFMYSSIFKRKVVLGLLLWLFIIISLAATPWWTMISSLAK
ncbi:MAG: permease [Verrucomicrobiaceae bacterium]|nr:permease [Verrucomicrobiaceae bacterium]